MEELLNYILKKITANPKDVKVEKEEENNEVKFLISINEEDKGRVIGKNGSNIKSIRLILSILAKREDKKVYLKVQ